MPLSALVYRDRAAESQPARATIVTLHDNRGSLDDLVGFGRGLGADLRIVALEAARGVHDSHHFVIGHSWFGGERAERPEPASFGDSLSQLERFTLDVRSRVTGEEPVKPWILGVGAGATMGLAGAGVLADLIAGVVAVCGVLPEVSGWEVLQVPSGQLPVLLVSDPEDSVVSPSRIAHTIQRLDHWNAQVTHRTVVGAHELPDEVVTIVREWLGIQTGNPSNAMLSGTAG